LAVVAAAQAQPEAMEMSRAALVVQDSPLLSVARLLPILAAVQVADSVAQVRVAQVAAETADRAMARPKVLRARRTPVAVAAASAATVSATLVARALWAFVTSSRLQTKSQSSTPLAFGLRHQARLRCSIWLSLEAAVVAGSP
jgi:hypothetical protein